MMCFSKTIKLTFEIEVGFNVCFIYKVASYEYLTLVRQKSQEIRFHLQGKFRTEYILVLISYLRTNKCYSYGQFCTLLLFLKSLRRKYYQHFALKPFKILTIFC